MKKQLRSYGIITVGSVIFALSFDWFFAANAVGMGGITGLADFAVEALLGGSLADNPNPNCDHHDGEHGGHCEHHGDDHCGCHSK